ncbi:MAG: hypothetical protein WD646_08180 [Actinomycetota bacterium]
MLLPEDLIAFELVAGRHHDYESVGAIINAQGTDLDTDFIQRTLTEFGFEDRWTIALDEAARPAEQDR